MDDMAVDSDEEVDYSKMDQVWSLKHGWGVLGSYFLVHVPFPIPKRSVSLTGPHFLAAVIGAAALWGHGQLNYFEVFLQK